jgi:hypothetical protein
VSRLSLLVFCLASLFLPSCRVGERERINIGRDVVELLPVSQARPVKTNSVAFSATLSGVDFAGICMALGQVPTLELSLERVDIAWPEFPLAARVSVPGYRVYLVKSGENGQWQVKNAHPVYPERLRVRKD